jgi:K+ transporter
LACSLPCAFYALSLDRRAQLISTLASRLQIIASQTMITATFSLVEQLISLKAFPTFRKTQTSEKYQGQSKFTVICAGHPLSY